ncbi:ATP-dependent DNA helicase [Clostridium niameyense]|uniref:ATP-dependent DNA helicase n=1 Tax=Clostridium niameyense TaxID=1622073 RepID=A0A6M0RB35_9CLOT|nr:ATP-dependent DNA helicase [Clostridium niameyense]NEZ47504.1 ATP-dependent DNA helicase [Clostridium niameyense]
MSWKEEIKISVRNLIEFILRCGNIDMAYTGHNRALEGIKAHKKIQDIRKRNATPLLMTEYDKEVFLRYSMEYRDFLFTVEGRADGIIKELNNITVEEIKSTNRPLEELEYNNMHWAQAKCYGYIYSKQNNLDKINIQLTYYNPQNEDIKSIIKSYNLQELEKFFNNIIEKYYIWMELNYNFKVNRNLSIEDLDFPFREYRKGQRKLAVSVYKSIVDNKNIFIQAPTGIGKTISTIFPTVKAMGKGKVNKIFYLTAKNTTKKYVIQCLNYMIEKGLYLKVVFITSKEKICFKEKCECTSKFCEYAKGHFDRINESILDVLNNEKLITENVVKDYALKHKVCPFELSLDLSIWCDAIVCDYNYVFDPRVYLRRYFSDSNEDFVFLIDEAHNLVDRSREMFSCSILKKDVLNLKKIFRDKNRELYRILGKINSYMVSIKNMYELDNSYINEEPPEKLYELINIFISKCEVYFSKNKYIIDEKLMEFYFKCLHFIKIYDIYGENYITYGEFINGDLSLKLFCIDSSSLLKNVLKNSKSSVFFSATLSPIKYFRKILGGSEEDYLLKLQSPFPSKNRCTIIANNICTTYKNRKNTYEKISDYIKLMLKVKMGNYIVFFPSYKYMNNVYNCYKEKYLEDNIIIQNSIMTEEERESFLQNFIPNPKESMVGFCVLGGIFSEGIDLKEDRIIGVAIVGIGLPQICLERDIIKNYYEYKIGKGFEYAYIYPAMTKVLQAAGRLIRDEKDKGIILLLDERYNKYPYSLLLSSEWSNNFIVGNENKAKFYLDKFWINN